MKTAWILLLILNEGYCFGQPAIYSPANLHSHNDYEQQKPFFEAFENGFGSIEVDIFLKNGKLLVGHHQKEIDTTRSLKQMYLEPLRLLTKRYNGQLSEDSMRTLILLVDIKSPARPALDSLVSLLEEYPSLTANRNLLITISGNRPSEKDWNQFPLFIYFDGLFGKNYTSTQWERIPIISDNFGNYTSWNGKGIIPAHEKKKLEDAISTAHRHGKKVRFWNAPDITNAWYQLMHLQVDYINTDKIGELSDFLNLYK